MSSLRDPLLGPVPAPRRVVHAWNEGISLLHAQSTDIAIALANVAQAEAQSRGALAALLGTIRLDGAYSVNTVTTSVSSGLTTAMGTETAQTIVLPQRNYGLASLTATLPVIAPRAWVGLRTTSLAEDVARADLANVERTVRQGLAGTIVAAVAAEKAAEMSHASLAAALDRLGLVTRKKDLGGGTILDVVRGQQDLEAARAQVLAANESLHQARESLGLALGLREEVAVDPAIRLDEAIAEVRAACPKLVSLDRRPDLLASARRVEVAHQVVNDARAEFLPTASLQAFGSTTNQDLSPYPQNQWLVQGLISWNLWDGGTRYADLRSGQAQETAASARLEQNRRSATVEVTRALRAVDVTDQTRQVAERETAFAAQQERLTRIGYETGQGTSLELIAAASAHRAQEINLALREYDVVSARLNALFVQASCNP